MPAADAAGTTDSDSRVRSRRTRVQLGLIGLGKMGGNMAERLRRAGHEVVGFDRNPDASATSTAWRSWSQTLAAAARGLGDGARPASRPGRPSTSSASCSSPGDIVIDGGNSRFTDDQVHAAMLRREGHRLRRRRRLRRGLGPGERLRADGRRRRRTTSPRCSRSSTRSSRAGEGGFVHAGPVGAGHFAKMVHNGIEYGMMQAYGEGYELLEAVDLVDRRAGASSAPGTQGTVIRSWLLDLLVRALEEDPDLERDPRLRRGLRRGPVDRRGGDRARRADAGRSPRRCSPGSPPGRTTRRR